MPKSITFTAPARLIMTLAGFMSRCTMPLRWLKSSAAHTSAMTSIARRGAIGPSLRTMSRSVSPSTYSITMYGSGPRVGLRLAGVVDGHDRRMVQRRRVLRLAPEPQVERGVAGEVGAQDLDRDVTAEPDVAGEVDLGHATEAEDLAQLVAGGEVARCRHGCPCGVGVVDSSDVVVVVVVVGAVVVVVVW